MRLAILHQLLGNASLQRIRWIRISEERADREQRLGYRQRGRPLVFQNIQTDFAGVADVAVVNLRPETNLSRSLKVLSKYSTQGAVAVLQGRKYTNQLIS